MINKESIILSHVRASTQTRCRRKSFTAVSGWMFLLPALLFLLIFIFVPVLYVVYLSLLKWNLLSAHPKFVGLHNYLYLFTSRNFLQALANTGVLSAGMLLISLPLALFVAVLLDMRLRATNFYRTVLFGPYVVPLVGSGLAFTLIYNKDHGVINQVLALLHVSGPDWLGNGRMAMVSVVLMSVWQYVGYYMLIFLSGLQSVPQLLKEAAAVDGAGKWRGFFTITLPSLSPSLFFALIICIIQSLQTFDQVYIMTGGGPDGATSTLVYYIFNEGFQMYNIGTSTAASVVLLLILSLLTLVQVKLSRRWVVDES